LRRWTQIERQKRINHRVTENTEEDEYMRRKREELFSKPCILYLLGLCFPHLPL